MASTSFDDHHNNSIDATRFQNQLAAHAHRASSPSNMTATAISATMPASSNDYNEVANESPNLNSIPIYNPAIHNPASLSNNLGNFNSHPTGGAVGGNNSLAMPYAAAPPTNCSSLPTYNSNMANPLINPTQPFAGLVQPSSLSIIPPQPVNPVANSPQHVTMPSPRASTPTNQSQQQHLPQQHSPQLSQQSPIAASPTTTCTPPPINPTGLMSLPPPPINIHAVQEAKEKHKQEKKEKHATKKLMKELSVCKTLLGEMEVSLKKNFK